MAIANIPGRGYGPDATIAFICTRGYGISSVVPPVVIPPADKGSGGGRGKKKRQDRYGYVPVIQSVPEATPTPVRKAGEARQGGAERRAVPSVAPASPADDAPTGAEHIARADRAIEALIKKQAREDERRRKLLEQDDEEAIAAILRLL